MNHVMLTMGRFVDIMLAVRGDAVNLRTGRVPQKAL